MCRNTRPKLLDVSYGRTSHHNKSFFNYELNGCIQSPFKECRTHCEHARHGGFQTLDVEHRTDSRRPLDQPPGTTTETDEEGDRRRRRRAKTETAEDEDRLTLGTSEVAAPLQPTTPQSDEDGT